MTVGEAIEKLKEFSDEGFGDYQVKMEYNNLYLKAYFAISANEDESDFSQR